MQTRQMQEAKPHLPLVVRDAEREGHQQITVHGRPVALVLWRAAYDRPAATGESLVAFVRRMPLAGTEDLDVERERSVTRAAAP